MQSLHPPPVATLTFTLTMAQEERKATRSEGVLVMIEFCLAHSQVEAQRCRQLPVRVRNAALQDVVLCDNTVGNADDLGERILDDFDGLRRTTTCE